MQAVTIERHKYIGGSDIPIILGISHFKTRFNLLLEKAQLKTDDFKGNAYTEYGNEIEPLIRDYLNETEKDKFLEGKIIEGDRRYHSDGQNKTTILEIKSTSQIHEKLEDYKVYLAQLVDGMSLNKKKKGKLAVYERPGDFEEQLKNNNVVFEKDRLKVYDIEIKDYKDLVEEIEIALDLFRKDLDKVKTNPYITEEDLQPKELIEISSKVVNLEQQLLKFEEIIAERDKLKKQLKEAMQKFGVTKWTTPNDTKITLVADGAEKVEEVFNETKMSEEQSEIYKKYEEEKITKVFNKEKFIEENKELYEKYIDKKIKKGRAGYVLITLAKER